MVDRSRTWSEAHREWKLVLALLVVVAASIGGVLGATGLSDVAERYSIPGLSADDDAVVESGRAVPGATEARLAAARSNGHGRVLTEVGSPAMWHWSDASPGRERTVFLSIDAPVYPIGGLRWYVNGTLDRNDIYGPLDDEFGLWHSSTRDLLVGDIVSACWVARDGVERCPQIVIR